MESSEVETQNSNDANVEPETTDQQETNATESNDSHKNGDSNAGTNTPEDSVFMDDSAVDVSEANQTFEHVNTENSEELEDNEKSNCSKDPFETSSSDAARTDAAAADAATQAFTTADPPPTAITEFPATDHPESVTTNDLATEDQTTTEALTTEDLTTDAPSSDDTTTDTAIITSEDFTTDGPVTDSLATEDLTTDVPEIGSLVTEDLTSDAPGTDLLAIDAVTDTRTADPSLTDTPTETVSANENNENDQTDVIDIGDEPEPAVDVPEGTYYCTIQTVEVKNYCMICCKTKVVKYCCQLKDEKTFLCDDDCLYKLQQENTVTVREYFTKFYCPVQVDSNFKFSRQCKQCASTLKNVLGICSWEAMDFCKEECLFRYQRKHGKNCTECSKPVAFNQLGKYAVRFGCIIRQFCSSSCLETRKKKIKICSYCQKSINRTKTMIGNKYFCHDICKGMFEFLQKPRRPPFLLNPDDARCFVCKSMKQLVIEFDYHYSSFYFCSPSCFTIFKFIQNSETPKKCHTCSKFVLQQYLEHNALYYDNFIHYFCSKTCQYIYIITHRRVLPCIWCKVKKYNFDMIQKHNFLESTVYTCSIFCLSQLKVSVDAVVSKQKPCANCAEMGLYELKFGNGQTHMFCSNHCISIYQTQYVAASQLKRTRGRTRQILPDKPGPLPVITNVCSLASNAKVNGNDGLIKKIVVIKSPDLPEQRNVATMVEVIKFDKECQETVEKCTATVQTDDPEEGISINPILVPIYVPSPMHGWQAPVPTPVPFPLVIPAPILIPLTKKTAATVMKEFKKVDQVKAPADPFEAELLMMAELVAAEKKDDVPEVESEDDAPAAAEETYSPEPQDSSTTFGDDMLQMALKMATDFEEPPVDLEGALAASTITPSQVNEVAGNETAIDDSQQSQNNMSRQSVRGKRKVGRPTRQTASRRGRRPAQMELMVQPEEPAAQPTEPVEKPDANMCLKYTFGVNAWKQWITTKNTDLERSSRRLKLFNTELLQLTSDELNYSLCLFVDEVKKPNASDYAPDTIYYLCLGIQQYLYENGRIDNIFCDSYYEKFTDCLDEVCKKFTALYNDSHYIVTRVEEEHLWESKQLGAHSPHVLLSTLMFFNTKHFNLTDVDEHMQLSFSHIMKHWKRNPNQPAVPKQPGSRNVLLRFYPPQSSLDGNARKKKVYEQQENEDNPLRCPVKLYEFYLSKCPESVKTRNDVFYLLPERSCVPDSPVWYSTMALDRMALEKMLNRIKIVKEINVALLTN